MTWHNAHLWTESSHSTQWLLPDSLPPAPHLTTTTALAALQLPNHGHSLLRLAIHAIESPSHGTPSTVTLLDWKYPFFGYSFFGYLFVFFCTGCAMTYPLGARIPYPLYNPVMTTF